MDINKPELPKPEGLFDRVIQFAIQNAIWVMLFVLAWIGVGIWSYQKLPIDAVPDITNTQVQINTQANGYTALEVEQRITYPIENAMAGIPNLEQTRSISRYGLSQVTIIFKDGTDIYWARQLINQRLQEADGQLPESVDPIMSPVSTGLGEIYQWVVKAKTGAKKADGTAYTAMDLREIQDWIVRPQLQRVKGVAEINSIGGYNKTYIVSPDLKRLQQLQISINEFQTALQENNENRGAGFIEENGEQLTVRVPGMLSSVEDIQNITVSTKNGLPIRVADVANVSIGHDLRTGAATYNGEETVLGIAMMMMGENSRTVAQAVDAKIKEIQSTLPKGVEIETVYDRTSLVNKAIATVQKNLVEGAILVIVILFIFLGNFRAALITACVIPLSMLFTLTGMAEQNISANLMSLGALDFGIIVDGAVVIVENCIRRLAEAQHA
ncbi:MAG: efflux RND transporter permease subunit, partial [Acinetobacter baumannii]